MGSAGPGKPIILSGVRNLTAPTWRAARIALPAVLLISASPPRAAEKRTCREVHLPSRAATDPYLRNSSNPYLRDLTKWDQFCYEDAG
jgi:hypothetical protein